MKSFSIGNLSLLSNGISNANFILQTPIQGLESPEYRINYYGRPGQDGGIVSSMFYDKRMIILTGIVYASDPASFESARQQLFQACAINKDSNGYPVPTRVAFTTLANNNYFVNAYIDKPMFAYKDPNYSQFQLTMTVTDPFIRGSAQTVSSAITIANGGGFVLPVNVPIVSDNTTGGSGTINNVGSVAAYPIVTLTGPLTNPYLYNAAVNKYIQLNYSLPAGNTVTIDMLNKTINLNGSSSLLNTKTTGSDWWPIQPGNNNLSFSSAVTNETGTAVISFYPPYGGI